MQPTDIVQPIIVSTSGSHLATIAAAARASVLAYLDDPGDPMWEQWLAGPFTKTVRREKLPRMRANPAILGTPQDVSGSLAIAGYPSRYADLPKAFMKLQVSGTDLPRSGATPSVGPVILEVLDTLSTGKACAQAAHALWLWMLPLLEDDPEKIADWHARRAPVQVDLVPDWVIAQSVAQGITHIRDNGLTEVDPGTVTAVARNI